MGIEIDMRSRHLREWENNLFLPIFIPTLVPLFFSFPLFRSRTLLLETGIMMSPYPLLSRVLNVRVIPHIESLCLLKCSKDMSRREEWRLSHMAAPSNSTCRIWNTEKKRKHQSLALIISGCKIPSHNELILRLQVCKKGGGEKLCFLDYFFNSLHIH